MSEQDLGLTIEDQASPDLNDGNAEPVADGSVEGATEVPEEKSETKRVSDRINEIRAESKARIEELERQLEEKNNSLLSYRANEQGISVEELMTRDRLEDQKIKDALHKDPEFLALQQKDYERTKSEVLTRLQDCYPEEKIESIDNLPKDFYKMLQVGVDPVIAYAASVADRQRSTPPSTGSVRSQGVAAEGGITTEQLQGMSTREIVDNWDKIFPE